jgi:hypothetical protein
LQQAFLRTILALGFRSRALAFALRAGEVLPACSALND